jgi:hypothetical protein
MYLHLKVLYAASPRKVSPLWSLRRIKESLISKKHGPDDDFLLRKVQLSDLVGGLVLFSSSLNALGYYIEIFFYMLLHGCTYLS